MEERKRGIRLIFGRVGRGASKIVVLGGSKEGADVCVSARKQKGVILYYNHGCHMVGYQG